MDEKMASSDGSELLSRLPPEVLKSLSAEQRAALWSISRSSAWKRKPINLRVSLNLFGQRMFLTVVGGAERRSAERVQRDRHMHRLGTRGNVLFLISVASISIILAVALGFLIRYLRA